MIGIIARDQAIDYLYLGSPCAKDAPAPGIAKELISYIVFDNAARYHRIAVRTENAPTMT